MSAFIVSNRHIDFLLTYAEKKRVPALAAFMMPYDDDHKALHYLDYQCCEVGNHPEKFVELYDGIMDCAISNLPGYSQAAWGIQ